MVRLISAAIFIALACFAVARASAQTPDGVTPEPTELTEPSPTPTDTPIVAAPDEIVFTGELAVPPGTTVSALFEGRTSATCATGTTASDRAEFSSFVLRVPASCAEVRFGPTICWSDAGCYLNLAWRPGCEVFIAAVGGCRWSDTVAPGKVVDFGTIPIAGPGEIIVLGQVPVPPGTTVRMLLGDFRAQSLQLVYCGESATVSASNQGASLFELHIDDACSRGLDFPSICWPNPPCYRIPYDHPFERLLQPGRTIVLAPILDEHDPNATPTPLPGNPAVGGGPLLPHVGARTEEAAPSSAALFVVAFSLLAATAAAAAIARLRRA